MRRGDFYCRFSGCYLPAEHTICLACGKDNSYFIKNPTNGTIATGWLAIDEAVQRHNEAAETLDVYVLSDKAEVRFPPYVKMPTITKRM